MEIASKSNYRSSIHPNKPAPLMMDTERCKSLARKYISTQLRRNGFTDIARQLPRVKNPSDHVHEVLKEIADTLDEERGDQFDEMLSVLSLDDRNIEHTYDTIVYEMFKDTINWGKIVTFITFSAHMAVHCAKKEELRPKVQDIVSWTDKEMEEKLQAWIMEQGGLQAFIQHYDTENWRVSLSTAVVGLGMGLAVLAGGLITLKRFFT